MGTALLSTKWIPVLFWLLLPCSVSLSNGSYNLPREWLCPIDLPFVVEEIETALHHHSSGGHDQLSLCHLMNWICKIFNAIASLMEIPPSFKEGIVLPIYKNKGKIPSYRRTTEVSPSPSVLLKTSDYALLEHILPVLSDSNLPQLMQTAFLSQGCLMCWHYFCLLDHFQVNQRGWSCLLMFLWSRTAFDTVKYPVLLSHLKSAGISGKTWQLIRNWYTNPKSSVHVNNIISSPFNVNRGVSISPLFLLVRDPILLKLRTKSCGLSVNGLFLGALPCPTHADDIRTLLTNLADCGKQISFIHLLTSSCNLSLNANKCEAVISPSVPVNASSIRSDDIVIPIFHSARCFGGKTSDSVNCSTAEEFDPNIGKWSTIAVLRHSRIYPNAIVV